MEPLRPFYEDERKVLLMLKINHEPSQWSWQVPAAAACFVMALVAGMTGTMLTTGWILNQQLHPALHNLGLTLLILSLPIGILGGHCLDLLDRKRKRSDSAKSC